MKQLVAPVLCLVVLTGCSGPAATTAAPSATQATAPGAPACPAPTAARFAWPAGYPQDLPRLPGASSPMVTTQGGLVLASFDTATSLRESVVTISKLLQDAGFQLGRGDAEATEADAPFARGAVRGVMKMRSVAPCRTTWLVAVTSAGSPGVLPLPPLPPATTPVPP